jgi:hypothetical protein
MVGSSEPGKVLSGPKSDARSLIDFQQRPLGTGGSRVRPGSQKLPILLTLRRIAL